MIHFNADMINYISSLSFFFFNYEDQKWTGLLFFVNSKQRRRRYRRCRRRR